MQLTRLIPGFGVVAGLVGCATVVHFAVPALSQLTLAILLGVVAGNTLRLPTVTGPGIAFAARRLMRLGVALLGMEVSLSSITSLGTDGVLAVLTVVVITILGVTAMARALGLPSDFGLLIGVGYGICGASAIAAAKTQLRATEEQVSYALALVALCGTLSIVALPVFGVGLTDAEFGRWAGAAVHDVGQVVATASTRSDHALQVAVVVKLARVALLAPVVVLLSLRARRLQVHGDGQSPPVLPLFVISFIGLAVLHSTGSIPEPVTTAALGLGKLSLAAGLAALGLGVRWQALRAVGGRPLVLGLAAWVLVAVTALAGVLVTTF